MKKFIALLFSIVLSFNALFAQRLNSKGQQMVSSIKVYNNTNKLKFTFSFYYDEQNRLVKMTNYGCKTNYEIWYANNTLHKKIEGNLKNGTWDSNQKYEYHLDKNRNILKKVTKCYDAIGANKGIDYERWEYNFTYGYPASDTIYQVVKSEQNYVPVEVKNKKTIPRYEYIEKTIYKFKFECGNEHMFLASERYADGRTATFNEKWGGSHQYSSYRNMTNLNMNYVLNLGYITGEYAECATEWCNHFSYCLPEDTTGDIFVYHFREEEPYALYMVEIFYSSGNLKNTFIIQYVDEK